MRYFITLILFFLLAAYPHHVHAASSKATRSAGGKLQVWVPAGYIGDDYWLYLDGHLVSAPPHNTPESRTNLLGIKNRNGWEFWGVEGLVLRSIGDEGWDRDYSPYDKGAAARDGWHLFQPVELPLRAGSHLIDLVVLQQGSDFKGSFPFVASSGWQKDIRKGKTTQLFLPVPNNFSNVISIPEAQAFRLCPGGPAPPDLGELQGLLKEYSADPMVKALRRVSATAHPKGRVVLYLPPEQGGAREYDDTQIRHIADTIGYRHNFPKQSDVNECQQRFPQFSKSYARYGELLSAIDKEHETFRKLADELKESR
jgi:hypothetical protein